jgi:hypothetical protein
MMVLVCARARPEPRSDIQRFGEGIVEAAVQRDMGVNLAMMGDQHGSRRVKLFQQVLVRSKRSATAVCFAEISSRSSVSAPFTASTAVTTPPGTTGSAIAASGMRVYTPGPDRQARWSRSRYV